MIKDIKYNGFSESPSDYLCPDGDLSGAINLVPEDSTLKPIQPPAVLFNTTEGNVIYIHKAGGEDHFIIQASNNNFVWGVMDGDELKTNNLVSLGSVSYYGITSVGNTLVILTSEGPYYLLWSENQYKQLGYHIPETAISFGLQGGMEYGDTFKPGTRYYNRVAPAPTSNELTDEESVAFTNAVLGQVNKFVAERATNEGKFIFPFLVRYAYRLYDGSLTMHSDPVLMLPNFGATAPIVYWTDNEATDESPTVSSNTPARVAAFVHSLDYRALDVDTRLLNEWKDIVRSVDIFISAPFYTYNQSGTIKRAMGNYSILSSICRTVRGSVAPDFGEYDIIDLVKKSDDRQEIHINIPQQNVDDSIRNCSTFYFLKSIDIAELKTERTIVNVDKSVLGTLYNREENKDNLSSIYAKEVMTDDYGSHDTIIAKQAFSFNSRINLSGISRKLGDLAFAFTHFCFANHSGSYNTRLYASIKKDGNQFVVQSGDDRWSENVPTLYLYHHESGCQEMYLEYKNDKTLCFPMSNHETLNGSVYYKGMGRRTDRTSGEVYFGEKISVVQEPPAVTTDNIIPLPNKIYTSEINNPFYFPLLGINTVGTGEIYGISAATKALSQGQFGQFPLYAFTSEGVWALETNSNGTYSARQPVTRDVCINANSITQLDNAVLFATNRGIMILSGSNSVCMTDSLRSESTFSIADLPGLLNVAGFNREEITTLPFDEFNKDARCLYDYNNQRIIVYNPRPDILYAYVYSLESKMWGMMVSNITSGINSYPDAYAMDNSGNLLDLSHSLCGAGDYIHTLLVTRPLKIEMPDTLKTIDTIIQRGQFRGDSSVSIILYGSRDLFNWHLVSSSSRPYLRGYRGTPYKYFRIAVVGEFLKDESLTGSTIGFTPRYENKPR